MRRLSPVSAILIGGAIAATLDLIYTISFSTLHEMPPLRILQSVASGLLGKPAFEGGVPIAVFGLTLHFLIAFAWAAIFYLASRAIPALTHHPVIAGAFYGFLIYAVMNLAVLRFSAYPQKVSYTLFLLLMGLLVHMFFIGLPISLAVRRTKPDEV